MRILLLFLFLFSLVISPNPETQEERRNKVNSEMRECILKEDISPVFKKEIEDDPNGQMIEIIRRIVRNLESKDREALKKCRKEILDKYKDIFKNGKFYKKEKIAQNLNSK